MDKEELELLIDLHKGTDRQGPGGETQTRLAIELSGLKPSAQQPLRIADVGSGSGAASIVLAQEFPQAHITAVDVVPSLLQALKLQASRLGKAQQIDTVETFMTKLPFKEKELDAIWSEGAIYNIGFEKGIQEWRNYLKPGGILAASELTWLTNTRPAKLHDYWCQEYPQVDTASAKIALLEKHGYTLLGYFVLPTICWTENYYGKLDFVAFLERNGHSELAQKVATAQQQEIRLYQEYQKYFGYGYYIAQRADE